MPSAPATAARICATASAEAPGIDADSGCCAATSPAWVSANGSLPGLRLATPGFWKSCAYSDLVESIGDGVYAAVSIGAYQAAIC